MQSKRLTFDFETQSEAPLKRCGAYEYSMHRTTIATCLGFKLNTENKVYLLDYYQMQKPWTEQPEKFKKFWTNCIAENYLFCAHNLFFETCIYTNVLVKRLGWPEIPLRLKRCTAAKAAACAIPRNLDGAGQVMRLTTQKSFEGHRVMMKLCKPTAAWNKWAEKVRKLKLKGIIKTAEDQMEFCGPEPLKMFTPETAPEDYQILYKYCKIDVVTEELLDAALPDLNDFEQQLWFLDQQINFRGVAVDIPVVKKISKIMADESRTMNKNLDVLTMGLVSSGNARNQILDFLKLEEIELPDLRAKTVEDFLKNGDISGDARKLLKIRQALSKASTAKYQKFLGCAASDGRVRDLFLYHGASTGRWGGKNVQPQNFPRGIIKDIDEAIEQIKTSSVPDLKMLYGENLMPLFSSVLRGMFVATKGHELFVEDFSAIETRVVFWLAGHEAGLDLFRNGVDPYKDQASDIFKKPIEQITDDERQVGKAAILGCGFQMGWKKFKTAAWDVYRAKVEDDVAKLSVTSYRKKHWPVAELWDDYNRAAIWAIENYGKSCRAGKCVFFSKRGFLWVELPSKRRLAYRTPSVEMGEVFIEGEGPVVGEYPNRFRFENGVRVPQEHREDDKIFQAKKIKYYAVNHKVKKDETPIPKWAKETTYGGKLTENIVQAVARDLLAETLIRAERAGFKVLMHAHDELVSEAPIGKWKPEAYKKIMQAVPDWAPGLPLKTAGWVGGRYQKK